MHQLPQYSSDLRKRRAQREQKSNLTLSIGVKHATSCLDCIQSTSKERARTRLPLGEPSEQAPELTLLHARAGRGVCAAPAGGAWRRGRARTRMNGRVMRTFTTTKCSSFRNSLRAQASASQPAYALRPALRTRWPQPQFRQRSPGRGARRET